MLKKICMGDQQEQVVSADDDGGARRVAWSVRASTLTVSANPIRIIVDDLVGKENPELELISLAQGDPTAYGHLKPPEEAVAAVTSAFSSGNHNGYTASTGLASCRTAIAAAHSYEGRPPLCRDDVFVTVGCSEALEHCIAVLAAPGSSILLPSPGFPLYETICRRHGIVCRFYSLLPEQGWEADLSSIKRLTDETTAAVLINNPSNPCGAVYSREHLQEIVQCADELKLPIIADEVYAGMTFDKRFVPVAEVATEVPVFSVGALSKRWLVPGWRLGWVCVHDVNDNLLGSGVREAINSLCQISLGPSVPLQAAVPSILFNDDKQWLADIMGSLKLAAATSAERASKIEGLSTVTPPQGAMYVLIQVDLSAFKDCPTDVKFAEELLAEESVLVLPGNCFKAPGFVRIVTTVPVSVLQTAWDRIEAFCSKRIIKSRKGLACEARAMVPAHPVHFGLPRVASQVGGHEGLLLRPHKP